MASGVRTPFQGAGNIVRFNWPYYAFAFIAGSLLIITAEASTGMLRQMAAGLFVLVIGAATFSLFVSWYVYDHSGIYDLDWLDRLEAAKGETMLNINAGFDETSILLQERFDGAELIACDFYDPAKHTARSIRRARRAYPPFPGTRKVQTFPLLFDDASIVKVFAILSAHEIRDPDERRKFFAEIQRILTKDGTLIVVEHLRDIPNFLAFNLGAFHFHPRTEWLGIFRSSQFGLRHEVKLTPFITAFFLTKNGDAS
jgi:SAM-dependent methyltransferase